jgi:hypothetical protein
MLSTTCFGSLNGFATADHPEQDDHDGNNQENVDESAHGRGSNESQQPENDKNDGNGIEHGLYPFVPGFQSKQFRYMTRDTMDWENNSIVTAFPATTYAIHLRMRSR